MLADRLILAFDRALRAVVSAPINAGAAAALLPAKLAQAAPATSSGQVLSPAERAHAAALMRVNHVGEVCAQALYHGQALTAHRKEVRAHMERAAAEEGAHLTLCAGRIGELGGRTSLLNPLWYAGAFALGALAGRQGDAVSLGFVAETERQVEAHLESHLAALPATDLRSRAIVAGMAQDEARHRADALMAGGVALPLPARLAMKAMAKVMTTVSYRI